MLSSRFQDGLELARPFLGPAFDDNLSLGEKLYGVLSLPVQIAKKAILPAAERKESHRSCNPDVEQF